MAYLNEVMKDLAVLQHTLTSCTQYGVNQDMAVKCQDAVDTLIECLPKHDMTTEELKEAYKEQ